MRLRLPDQLNWRRFIGEVAIVVLGVMIALAADQAVKNYETQKAVEYTEASLNSELYGAARLAAERLIIERCLSDRIAHLSAKLDQSGGRWAADRLPPEAAPSNLALPVVYRAPKRPWVTNAWEVATASGVLQHIQRERVSAYANLYSFVSNLQRTNEQEFATAARLGPLATDRTLDQQGVFDAAVALSELDSMNGRTVANAHQFLNALKAMRIGYEVDNREASAFIAQQRRLRGPCVKNLRFRV